MRLRFKSVLISKRVFMFLAAFLMGIMTSCIYYKHKPLQIHLTILVRDVNFDIRAISIFEGQQIAVALPIRITAPLWQLKKYVSWVSVPVMRWQLSDLILDPFSFYGSGRYQPTREGATYVSSSPIYWILVTPSLIGWDFVLTRMETGECFDSDHLPWKIVEVNLVACKWQG